MRALSHLQPSTLHPPPPTQAHQATGTLAEVVLPKYDCIKYDDVADLRQVRAVHMRV